MATKIAEAYVDISVKTAPFKKQLSGLETATKKTTQNIQQRFQTLAPTFRKVGIGMAVAGGAITAALGLTIKSAMSFNKEMANIATLIPGATERVIELKGAIRGMAVEVGKSTADLAQGAYQVISAFGDTADTVAVLEIAAKAATAGVADTTSAINLLSAVTKGYGDTSKEAVQKASDLAFMTVKLGQTNFPQLEASIGRVIPLTAELGVSEEELFAVMATGTGVTGKAAEVSTQLRGVMQSLMSPTADMTKLFEDMGFKSGKAMLADLGLAGSLELIKTKADESNTPLQKYISSIEGQTIALALTGTQADTYAEKLKAMMDVTGQTDIAFREQTEGINKAGFAFEQAKIRIGVLGQEIGDRLLPMITPLIEKITDIVKKMSDWAKEHPKLSENIVKFAAVLGPVLVALGALLMVLPGIVAIAPAVGLAFTIMTGPIGIIIAAIGAAVAGFIYFYRTSAKFRATIKNIGEVFRVVFVNIANYTNWFKDNFVRLWATVLMGAFNIIKNFGFNAWEVIKGLGERIKGWGSWFGKNFLNVWKNLFNAIKTSVSNFGKNIWEQMKWIGEKMKPKNWFKKIEKPDWTPLLEGFEAVWEEMPKIAELQLKKLTENVKNYMEPLPELVKPVFAAVEEGAEKAGKAIDELGTGIDIMAAAASVHAEEMKRKWSKFLVTLSDFPEVITEAEKKIRAERQETYQEQVALFKALETAATLLEESRLNLIKEAGIRRGKERQKTYQEQIAIFKALEKAAEELEKARLKLIENAEKRNRKERQKTYKEQIASFKELERKAGALEKSRSKLIADAEVRNREERKKTHEEQIASFKELEAKAEDIEKSREELIANAEERHREERQETYQEQIINFKALEKAAEDLEKARLKLIADAQIRIRIERQKTYQEQIAIFKEIEREAEALEKARLKLVEEGRRKREAEELAIVRFFRDVVVPEIKKGTEEIEEVTTTMWERMGEAAKEHFSKMENYLADVLNALADVISGTKSLGDALLDLAYSIPIIGGIAEAIVGVVTAIWDWLTGAAAAKQAMSDMLEDITEKTEELSEAFKDVGASLTGSINDAERAIRNLMQTQEDLALNTREKLIKELDNYYDYRVLREMDLTELLALSAETREKLEKGTLESIAETAEETAEREKDAKVGTLKAIEDAYAKESALIEKKIKLIEIEIILLMAAAAAERGNLEEAEKLREKANFELKNLIYTQEELSQKLHETRQALRENLPLWKEFGREGRKAADDISDGLGLAEREIRRFEDSTNQARIGIELWGEDGRRNAQKITEGINRIPRNVSFNIWGNLHMPSIPHIRDRSFNIWGNYRPPNIPSYQVGIPNVPRTQVAVIHKKEAVLTASQAEDWRAGRGGAGGGTRVTYERGAIRMTVMGNLNNQVDLEEAMDYLAKKQTEKMRRP